VRIGLVHQHIIDASLDASQMNNHGQQQQQHQQYQQQQQQLDLGERSISAPPSSSYSYWELPIEEALFSPALPTTPYSSCSSTCTGISQLDDMQPHSLGLEHQYDENALLMNGMNHSSLCI
jgi:hypothetical protein